MPEEKKNNIVDPEEFILHFEKQRKQALLNCISDVNSESFITDKISSLDKRLTSKRLGRSMQKHLSNLKNRILNDPNTYKQDILSKANNDLQKADKKISELEKKYGN